MTKRAFLTWFVAKDGAEFTPENFPVFIRIHEDRSMYGAPAVDGVSVKGNAGRPRRTNTGPGRRAQGNDSRGNYRDHRTTARSPDFSFNY